MTKSQQGNADEDARDGSNGGRPRGEAPGARDATAPREIRFLEWELLQEPLRVEGQCRSLTVPDVVSSFSFTRDQDLSIVTSFEGGAGQRLPGREKPTPGTLVETADVRIETGEIDLRVAGYSEAGRVRSDSEAVGAKILGTASQVWFRRPDRSPAIVCEWLAGFAGSPWIFPGATERSREEVYAKHRGPSFEDLEPVASAPLQGRQESSWDHVPLRVTTDGLDLRIRAGTVPAEYASRSLRPGFIEFVCDEAEPPLETREAVREGLAFALGCPVALLGTTEFGASGDIVASTANTVGGMTAFYRLSPMPPAQLGGPRITNQIDPARLSRLVTLIVAHYRDLGLRNVFSRYSQSRTVSLDTGASLLGGAFEALRDAYYEAPARNERTKLLPRALWKEVRTRLEYALPELPEGHGAEARALRAKLGSLNTVPGLVANRRFFEDLGLEVGDVEEQAWGLRNDAAHGRRYRADEYAGVLRRFRALQTLVTRAILAALGWRDYVDYSSDGFPRRSISARLGGPAGDGRSARNE